MPLKDWLFKKGDKKDTATAILRIKKEIQRQQLAATKYRKLAEEQRSLAKEMLRDGNRVGAQQALKRRALYMSKINQIQNIILNLQTTLESIETAKSNVEVVSALEAGSKAIEKSIKQVDETKTELVMEKLRDQQERVSMSQETLADTSFADSMIDLDTDIDEMVDNQLAQLEAEISMGDVPEVPVESVDLPDVDVTETTQPAEKSKENKKKTAEDEVAKELEELKKQLEENS